MKRLLFLLLFASSLFAQGQDSIRAVGGVLTINLVPSSTRYKVFVDQTITSTVFNNPIPTATITVLFVQDSTGHTVAFGGNISGGCAVSGSVSSIASSTTACQFTFDAANNTWSGVGGGGTGGISGQQDITKNGAVAGKGVADGAMAATSSTFSANGNSTSPATPSGTTTFSNELLVSMYGIQVAFTPPGTPTARVNDQFSAANHLGLWMGDQTISSAGAYAANTGTIASSSWVASGIPLIPVAGQTIGFTASASNNAAGSSVTVTFASTPGQTLIACISSLSGYASTLTSNWNMIVTTLNGTQNLLCATRQTTASDPGSYTFSGTGTFLAAGIAEYTNVAAIDNTLTSATANFSSANVGQTVCAENLNALGQGFLNCSPINIVSNATTIYPLFTSTQTSSVTGTTVTFGPDSSSGFTGALTALGSAGGNIYIPPGIFFLTAGKLKLPYNITVNIIGAGAQATVGPSIGNNPLNAAGGSYIVGLPDAGSHPLIDSVQGPGAGNQIYQVGDLIQGITLRSTKTGGDCIDIAMEFVTIQKNDLIGCGNDGIKFLLNSTVFTGLDAVKQNFIEWANNFGVEIATSTTGSNYLIEQNEMDSNTGGGISLSGQQQVSIKNNQLQFGGPAISVTGTTNQGIAIGPSNWINGVIQYLTAGGQGPDIFDNFFENSQLISFNGQVGAKITGNFFFVGTPFKAGSTQSNLTMDATNGGGGFTQSFSGTSGTASCAYSVAGGQTRATCFLNGYAETGTAQTWTYPLAMATTPFLTESGGSCGAQNPSTNATILTLPANAGMTAETCQIIVEGQTN